MGLLGAIPPYTSLSRCMKPATNLLIEYFKPELLDAIANSNAMKAMKEEFAKLEKNAAKTKLWADSRSIWAKTAFKRLFDETQHCRHVTSTMTSRPLPPEKAIRVITQPSKKQKSPFSISCRLRHTEVITKM